MDDFIAGLNDRARELVWSLDKRYQAWASQLSVFFQDLAFSESTFTGRPGDKFYQLSSSVNPVNMHSPWLFWEMFEELDDDYFLRIAEAGAFWSLSAVVTDHLVDGQSENPPLATLFQQKLLQNSLSCFREIFPSSSPFWGSLERYETIYTEGLGVEAYAQKHPESLTYNTFVKSAKAKASSMLVTIAAYAEASDQPYLLKPIEKSIQYCALAGQLYDDFLDWQEDRLNGHITWVLLELMRNGERNDETGFPSQTSGDNQVRDWKDLDILKDVVNRFAQAEEAVKELNCPGWKRFLSVYRELVLKEQKASAARHIRNLLSPVIGDKGMHRNE